MPDRVSGNPFERAVHEGLLEPPPRPARNTSDNPGGAGQAKNYKWVPAFLDAIASGTTVLDAARVAGVAPSVVGRARKIDPVFAAAWRECAIIATEMLEAEACRRAYHGVDRPVFYKGEECGTVREYSDALLTTLLKSRDPRYRDGGEDNRGPMTLNVQIVTVEAGAAGAPQVVDGRVVPPGVPAASNAPPVPEVDGVEALRIVYGYDNT